MYRASETPKRFNQSRFPRASNCTRTAKFSCVPDDGQLKTLTKTPLSISHSARTDSRDLVFSRYHAMSKPSKAALVFSTHILNSVSAYYANLRPSATEASKLNSPATSHERKGKRELHKAQSRRTTSHFRRRSPKCAGNRRTCCKGQRSNPLSVAAARNDPTRS